MEDPEDLSDLEEDPFDLEDDPFDLEEDLFDFEQDPLDHLEKVPHVDFPPRQDTARSAAHGKEGELRGRKAHSIRTLTQQIVSNLPESVSDDAIWEIEIDDVIRRFGSNKCSTYLVFNVLETLLLASKVY